MKILHMLGAESYLPWNLGGSVVSCHRLCQNLQKLSLDVLVAFHQTDSHREPLGKHVYEQVPVYVLPAIRSSAERTPIFTRTAENANGFEELLREHRPDVVHFHDFTAHAGIAHMRLAKAFACKLTLTYHTPGNSCAQHGLLYRGRRVCDGEIRIRRCTECRLSNAGLPPILSGALSLWNPGGLNPEAQNKFIRALTFRKMTEEFRASWLEMLDLVDALHVHAEWAREVVRVNGAADAKIAFFRTGGPDPDTLKRPSPYSGGELKIAFAGRSTWIKGMHVLVEAVKQLPPDLPVKITFFRPNSDWQEAEYGRNLEKRVLGDVRFEFKYGVQNDQWVQLLAEQHLCAVPSLWLETGPLTVLEAFAAGIPVVGSRLGGIAELVRDGENGLLFDPGDARQLARIILNIIRNPAMLRALQDNIKVTRTMADVARDTRSLYERILKMDPRSPVKSRMT